MFRHTEMQFLTYQFTPYFILSLAVYVFVDKKPPDSYMNHLYKYNRLSKAVKYAVIFLTSIRVQRCFSFLV